MIKQASINEIICFFESTNKNVITFVGYSFSEYNDRRAMLELAGQILDEFSPSSTIINIGATISGIGAVYKIAKDKGYTTSGIVSTQAKKYHAKISPYVDFVFYVEDSTWGGFTEGSNQLSPTSAVMVEISDVFVGIGGGEVSRDEMIAANRSGKNVRFFPADMNHQIARQRAQKKSLPEPTDFRGKAGEALNSY